MSLDELLNQKLMSRFVGGVMMRSYYSTLAELFQDCKPIAYTIGVPTQEHADILNGYALVHGMNNIRVRVDISTPHIYRQI